AGRQACNNPYNRQADEEAYKSMKISNIWEVPHKQFLELIQPSFSSIVEVEDMDAILARTHVILITDHGLYWRLAKVEKTNIRFVQWPADEPRDLLVQSQKEIFVNYKKNPTKYQLPPNFHEDMVWSQEVLHRLFEGETVARTMTIRGMNLFGESQPPRQILPRILGDNDLGDRENREKVETTFRNLKRSGPITIDLDSPEKKYPCTSGVMSKATSSTISMPSHLETSSANPAPSSAAPPNPVFVGEEHVSDGDLDDLEKELEEIVDRYIAEEGQDAMDIVEEEPGADLSGGDCNHEVVHDVCGLQVLQWFGLPVQTNSHGPFRASELNGMIARFAIHFVPISSFAAGADGMYLYHRDHHFTRHARYFDGGEEAFISLGDLAMLMQWENSKKVNVLSVEDLAEDVLFVSSTKAFSLQYLCYHEELLFRGHVSTRAIEHAYNVVFSKQATKDDSNVMADFRKLHQACMFYHLALQEFQTLGLHKTLVIDDEITDESLDVYSAFCHSSLYPPKKKASISYLVGDGHNEAITSKSASYLRPVIKKSHKSKSYDYNTTGKKNATKAKNKLSKKRFIMKIHKKKHMKK
ncbi:unnamed protein product, partial [Symbiodinium sp. CCMP2456]